MEVEVYEIWRTDFDWMENRVSAAISKKMIESFVGEEHNNAYSKAQDWLHEYDVGKMYLCWDEEIYPKLEIKKVWPK